MSKIEDVVFTVKGKVVSMPSPKGLPKDVSAEALKRFKILGSAVAGFTGSAAKTPPTVAAMGGAGGPARSRSPSPKPKKAAADEGYIRIPQIPEDSELKRDRGKYYLGDMMYPTAVELRYAIYEVLFIGSWITHNYQMGPRTLPIFGYPVEQFQPFFKKKFGSDYYGGAIGKFIHNVERWINANSETSPHGDKYITAGVYDKMRVANGSVPIYRQTARGNDYKNY